MQNPAALTNAQIIAGLAFDECIAFVREQAARSYYRKGDAGLKNEIEQQMRELVRASLVATADALEKLKTIRCREA